MDVISIVAVKKLIQNNLLIIEFPVTFIHLIGAGFTEGEHGITLHVQV